MQELTHIQDSLTDTSLNSQLEKNPNSLSIGPPPHLNSLEISMMTKCQGGMPFALCSQWLRHLTISGRENDATSGTRLKRPFEQLLEDAANFSIHLESLTVLYYLRVVFPVPYHKFGGLKTLRCAINGRLVIQSCPSLQNLVVAVAEPHIERRRVPNGANELELEYLKALTDALNNNQYPSLKTLEIRGTLPFTETGVDPFFKDSRPYFDRGIHVNAQESGILECCNVRAIKCTVVAFESR
jgi:hypothetical protein